MTDPLNSTDFIESRALGLRVWGDRSGSTSEVGRAYNEGTKGANGGPPHIHLLQEERFIVHTGMLRVRRGHERLHVGAGEEVRIPPRTVHTFRTEAPSTWTVEFRPQLRVWDFFCALFALPTNRRGYPRIGDLARLLRTFPDEFLYFPIIPVSVQKALAVPLSKLGPRPRAKPASGAP